MLQNVYGRGRRLPNNMRFTTWCISTKRKYIGLASWPEEEHEMSPTQCYRTSTKRILRTFIRTAWQYNSGGCGDGSSAGNKVNYYTITIISYLSNHPCTRDPIARRKYFSSRGGSYPTTEVLHVSLPLIPWPYRIENVVVFKDLSIVIVLKM